MTIFSLAAIALLVILVWRFGDPAQPPGSASPGPDRFKLFDPLLMCISEFLEELGLLLDQVESLCRRLVMRHLIGVLVLACLGAWLLGEKFVPAVEVTRESARDRTLKLIDSAMVEREIAEPTTDEEPDVDALISEIRSILNGTSGDLSISHVVISKDEN